MKKLVLTSVCSVAMAASAFAQGNVNWGGISFTAMTAQTNSVSYSVFTGGGSVVGGSQAVGNAGNSSTGVGFYYALLYQAAGSQLTTPTTLSALQLWSDTGLSATNSNNAGRLQVVNANSGATVQAFTPGVNVDLMVAGWSANMGSSYTNVLAQIVNKTYLNGGLNDYFGLSSTAFIAPATTSTSPGTTIFGSGAGQLTSLNTPLFELNPTPEPATMALAGLGGLSLLALRRKK